MSLQTRVTKLLVGRNVTPDATGIADLDNGEIAILRQDGTLLSAGDTLSDSEVVKIVQGTATLGEPRFSDPVQGRRVISWQGEAYRAAAEHAVVVGYDDGAISGNAAGGSIVTVTDDTEYQLIIVFHNDKGLWSQQQQRRVYHFTTGTGATEDDISSSFVTQINADTYVAGLLTATELTSGTNRGIQLVADAQTYTDLDGYDKVYFTVFISPEWGATQIVAARNVDLGVGTYEQVRDLELFQRGYRGALNQRKFPIPTGTSYATSGTTYDMYVIEHDDRHSTGDMERTIDSPLVTVVAIPAGTANGLNFEARMNPWMASTPGAFQAVVL